MPIWCRPVKQQQRSSIFPRSPPPLSLSFWHCGIPVGRKITFLQQDSIRRQPLTSRHVRNAAAAAAASKLRNAGSRSEREADERKRQQRGQTTNVSGSLQAHVVRRSSISHRVTWFPVSSPKCKCGQRHRQSAFQCRQCRNALTWFNFQFIDVLLLQLACHALLG